MVKMSTEWELMVRVSIDVSQLKGEEKGERERGRGREAKKREKVSR